MKLKRKNIILLIFVFIIPSLIFTTILFGSPWKKISLDLNRDGKEISINNEVNNQFSKYFIGKLFQTSLNLDRYDLLLENRNKVLVNNKVLSKEDLSLDPEGGAMSVDIFEKETKATSTLYAKIGDNDSRTINVESEPIVKITSIIYRYPEKVPLQNIFFDIKKNKAPINMQTNTQDSHFYIKNNIEAWSLKFIGIFILFSAAILYLKKLYTFFS
ncbi:MAG: hypothetical protein AAB394_02780 [Patescibacteria group bacterium]